LGYRHDRLAGIQDFGCEPKGGRKAWFDEFRVVSSSGKDRKPSPLAREYISAAIDMIALHSLREPDERVEQSGNVGEDVTILTAVNWIPEH